MWWKCPYCDEFGISLYDCEKCPDCDGEGWVVRRSCITPYSFSDLTEEVDEEWEREWGEKSLPSEQDDDEEEDAVKVLGEEV